MELCFKKLHEAQERDQEIIRLSQYSMKLPILQDCFGAKIWIVTRMKVFIMEFQEMNTTCQK